MADYQEEEDAMIPALPQSLRAIEVVLMPPRDPDSYHRIPLSKRAHSGDEYEDSDSDYASQPKRRKSPSRISLRQASRQRSVGPISELNDWNSEITDLEDGESETRTSRPTLRSRGSVISLRLKRPTRNAISDSEDELAQDYAHQGDDDYFDLVRSDVAPPKRSSRVKKLRAKPPTRTTSTKRSYREGSDSSIGYEPARRSARPNMNRASMKDPTMDDDDVMDEKQTNAPKYAAIKEIFQQLSPDSDSQFQNAHSQICESCLAESGGTKNPLIHCQGCSFSYHRGCIGPRAVREHRVTKIGYEDFVLQCKFCIQAYQKKDKRAPDHTLCQVCNISGPSCVEFSAKKTPKQEEKARIDNGGDDPITKVDPTLINNANNVLFRCTNCKRGYHFSHLPALTTEIVDNEDIKDNRLEEYSLAGWSCKDCIDNKFKVHALVAWRPLNPYHRGQTNLDFTEDSIEYLIKWQGRSHFHDTWMPGAWVFGIAPGIMRQAFHKRDSSTFPKMDISSAIEEEWLLADVLLNVKYRTPARTSSKAEDLKRIEDITSVFVKFQGLSYKEVIWDEPPPRDSGAPWEAFLMAYDEYLNGKYFIAVSDHKMRERILFYRSLNFGEECELKAQPPQLKKGKLMEYQIEGVNFLLYNFHQRQNVILADEMGLGKTVQIVTFISALTHSQPGCWPFLVVVPNATCPNWRRELKQWAPDLRVVTYHGGRVAQDLAYRHELYPDGPKGGMKAHVVIMSYEAAANLNSVFYGVKWVGLIVDEGQRLKNEETMLYKSLQGMKIPCRILLTGTPLQNNKRELFNLLQFIDAERNAEELDAKYAELTKDNLPELHDLIRPYFLRRTKAQVLKFLPPMAQIIVPVTMTLLQEKLSKSIMARNPELIKAIISRSRVKAGERKSMNNILSDLRQCLCHPFCFNGEIEDKTVDIGQMHRNLVEASPKLLLFDIMLPKLKERGHRVLIFSQYLHSLTILEDFLTGLNMPHARIDGSLSALEKQKRIDAYNAPNSPLFAMLLSTRAGGVGINLATADTVIIYDPDFNPHQDIQALSRAHRIGQKRKVLCFQLMTKNTVEEKIMQMGRKKMALDHALIESMDTKEEAEDLESILKHGAAALFSDESKDKITYDDASVDKLLDRTQIENTNTGDDDSAGTQFSFARIWANDKGKLESNDNAIQDEAPIENTSIWESILKEREAEHQRELAAKQQVYGRGARRRGATVDYKTNHKQRAGSDDSEMDIDDELYIDQNGIEDDSDDYEAITEASSTGKGKIPKGSQPQALFPQPPPPNNPKTSNALRQSNQPTAPNPKLPPSNPLQATQPQTAHNRQPQHSVNSNPHYHQPYMLTIASHTANPATILPNGYGAMTFHPITIQLSNGGRDPCILCYRRHATGQTCIDLNSELSVRLALDRLRAAIDTPYIQGARAYLFQRLQILANGRQFRH
ncbi:PHD/FYVE-zinc-finger like domain-containing protein [Xylaria bambusicola]|uniref:PHD/FYVE-zinc-finger like domain-containing protein n=1 Tax=Xylaria bambusicola TaxID=326684 RepID=UPI0020080F06|nr:PHD/FYVE-zinc-finger like domain-containing protein [Xylaria bambusicola]KAI0528280.1 PHD/FYVE-zinc-finger like domain-containing protein [Xylaria bambusicola]